MAADGPVLSFFEIHPENFLANAHARELLLAISEGYAISIHTVGLSIGSADGLDRDHLHRVRGLVADLQPVLVSAHLAWSTHGGLYLNDLLPLPYTEESLSVVATQLQEVQDALQRPLLVENPSSYVGFDQSTFTEVQFLRELVGATGCKLLCDVSNIVVSGVNLGFDAYEYIDQLPADSVAELHLGGFSRERWDDEEGGILIDTHASRIDDQAWALYAHALDRFGATPTLIEWDNLLPDLEVLLAEARRADEILGRITTSSPPHHAVAG